MWFIVSRNYHCASQTWQGSSSRLSTLLGYDTRIAAVPYVGTAVFAAELLLIARRA
jgi:hypothetical protein